MAPINHLSGIQSKNIMTDRLRMYVLTAGDPQNTPLLFLHGNTSGATIWEQFMLGLSDQYYCIAPDLRGYGQTDAQHIIDAERGMNDWVDDIAALADTMDLPKIHLVGHSMGGSICWGMIGQHVRRLRSVTVIAPGPPMGFGGIHGAEGIPNNKDYAGSGAGIVVPEFAERLNNKDRSAEHPLYSPRNVINRLFWKERFTAKREDAILEAMLQMHTGERKYPGDWVSSDYWPGVAPGKFGPVNAISSKYNRNVLPKMLQADLKPSLLWIQGDDDNIISNRSLSDPGYQGKMDLRDDWPGSEQFPAQPMRSQIEYAMQQYQLTGGSVSDELVEDCGHTPFIEKPEITKKALLNHLKGR